MNNRTVKLLEDGGRESDVSWKDLAVGDLVKVRDQRTGHHVIVLVSASLRLLE
jgi:hypothetical protein